MNGFTERWAAAVRSVRGRAAVVMAAAARVWAARRMVALGFVAALILVALLAGGGA